MAAAPVVVHDAVRPAAVTRRYRSRARKRALAGMWILGLLAYALVIAVGVLALITLDRALP